jgi:AraC-like DNA-binding protein
MSSRDRADDPQAIQDAGVLVADVRRALRTGLLRDSCSASAIASLFSMHRRTLNRHMNSLGLTFRQVANEVRFEIACGLLENTDMALRQVAAALGYSELSAFTRAFKGWCGQTPSEWRANRSRAR